MNQPFQAREKILKSLLERAQIMIDSIDPDKSRLGIELSKKYRQQYNRLRKQKQSLKRKLTSVEG